MRWSTSQSRRSFAVELLLVSAFCGFFFLWGLGAMGLTGADEPRYAQAAREMLTRHDWVTPWLYGKPWLEKPPLYYWGAMLSYSIFGASDWAARLADGFYASTMTVGVFLLLRRIRAAVALDAALLIASTAAVFGFARGADTDMPLAAFFTLAMVAWLVWFETRERWALAIFFLCSGIATLAKGPVAVVLAVAIIVAFSALRRDWTLIGRTLWIPGVLLFCIIALPWFVLVQQRNPQFFNEFIIQHNLERFGTNLYRHEKPVWYYLPVLFASVLPWLPAATAGIVEGWRRIRQKEVAETERSDRFVYVFLSLWAAVPVLFFSISRSKLPGYILPAIPAWAMLAALWMREREARGTRPAVGFVIAQQGIASLFLGAALLSSYALLLHPRTPPVNAWMIAGGLSLACFYIGVRIILKRGWPMVRTATLVPTLITVAFLVRIALPSADATLSARQFARQLPAAPALAVFEVRRNVEYGIAFYRDQPVSRYEGGEHVSGVPNAEHILVISGTPENISSRIESLAKYVGTRKLTLVGTYSPQELLIFRISAAK